MTRQSALTVLAPVAVDRAPALTALLREIGDDIGGNRHLRFADLPRLHHASLTVLPPFDAGGRPHLLFEANVDGSRAGFVDDLLDRAGGAVEAIGAHCDGFPAAAGAAGRRAVRAWLLGHDIGADTFYVAWPGRTVEEIRREAHLRDRIEAHLDRTLAAGPPPASPAAVLDVVRAHVRAEPELRWALRPAPAPLLTRYGRRVLGALLAVPGAVLLRLLRAAVDRRRSAGGRRVARLAIGVVVAVLVWTVRSLRAAEEDDERREAARPEPWPVTYDRWRAEHLTDVGRREDVHRQNHMTSVTAIKPGRFRLVALRAVLAVLDVTARLVANRGTLGGIPTIHFARWVITPDRRHLLFLSDHDGSRERYLGDAIELAARGLTAVWSNTDGPVGFPPTRWLVLGGAAEEPRCKAYARTSMVATTAWYSAYPDLPSSAIGAHMAVRDELFRPLDDAAARTYLRRL